MHLLRSIVSRLFVSFFVSKKKLLLFLFCPFPLSLSGKLIVYSEMSVERKEESASTVSREIRQSFDARTEGRVPTRKKRGGTRSDRSISSSTRNRTFSSFAIDKKTSSTTINLFLLYERFPSFLFTWKPTEKKSLLIHMPVIMYFIRYTHMLIHKTHVHTLMYLLRMSRVILSVVSILMIANHPLVENDQ